MKTQYNLHYVGVLASSCVSEEQQKKILNQIYVVLLSLHGTTGISLISGGFDIIML